MFGLPKAKVVRDSSRLTGVEEHQTIWFIPGSRFSERVYE
jgi:hypothetical protein